MATIIRRLFIRESLFENPHLSDRELEKAPDVDSIISHNVIPDPHDRESILHVFLYREETSEDEYKMG